MFALGKDVERGVEMGMEVWQKGGSRANKYLS